MYLEGTCLPWRVWKEICCGELYPYHDQIGVYDSGLEVKLGCADPHGVLVAGSGWLRLAQAGCHEKLRPIITCTVCTSSILEKKNVKVLTLYIQYIYLAAVSARIRPACR